MIKAGLTSVSFRRNSPKEIIEEAKKCGLYHIEWGSDVHAPCDNEAVLREIAHMQKEMGVNSSSYGTYFCLGRDRSEDIKSYIEAAKILGCDTLRIWSGEKASEDLGEDEIKTLTEECMAISEIAEKEGVIISTEFHIGTLTDNPESTLKLVKTVNSESFKTYWQPNQFKTLEWNKEAAKKVKDITTNLHVFNWTGKEHNPLTLAKDIWKDYFEIFKGDRYALLEFMPDNKIESLKEEAAALKNILEGLE